MTTSYLAILLAAIASFIVGSVWYGLLGKLWMSALGWTQADMAGSDGKRHLPVAPMVTAFIAELIMAFMLAGLIRHIAGAPTVRTGIVSAVFCWTAFVVTSIAVNNAFQKRRVLLTVIDGGHWLAVLVVQGAVIGWFG